MSRPAKNRQKGGDRTDLREGEIAESQEFAAAAKHDGIKYRDLLHRILTLGMQRAAGTVARAEKS